MVAGQLFAWLFIFISGIFKIDFVTAIPLNITSLQCAANPKYCTDNDCHLDTKRNGMKLANFQCYFPVPITSPMVEFKLFKSNGKNKKTEIFGTTEDVCKLNMNIGRSNNLIRMLPRLKQNSEYPTDCPMTDKVILRRYPLDLSFFPSVAPSGKYILFCRIFKSDTKETVVNATMTFEIKYFNNKLLK